MSGAAIEGSATGALVIAAGGIKNSEIAAIVALIAVIKLSHTSICGAHQGNTQKECQSGQNCGSIFHSTRI